MWLSWSCFLYSQSVHVLDFSQHTDICSTKFWVVTYMGLGQEVWLVAWSLVTLSLWLHINKSPITELAWLKHHHVFLLASSLLTTITAHGERHLIFEVNKMVSCKRIVKFPGIKLRVDPGKLSMFNYKVVPQPKDPPLLGHSCLQAFWSTEVNCRLLLLSIRTLDDRADLRLFFRGGVCSSFKAGIPFILTQGGFTYCLLSGPLGLGPISSLPRTKKRAQHLSTALPVNV